MVEGIYLTLLVGLLVPVPVPRVVLDALESVTVTSAAGSASGFQLNFTFLSKSPLNTIFLLAAGQNARLGMPPLRVILIVTINGLPQVLMDGVMTNVEVQAGQGGSPGTLTVTGDDLTKVMDMLDFGGLPYPAMPVEARVALIIAKYAVFGMIPIVVPLLFTDVPIPVDRIPAHKGTDLQYLQQLADEAGYVFYVEPGPVPGTNIAYFGPEIKVGVPQPALNVDMDAHTNVESLSFRFDSTKGVLPVMFIQIQAIRVPIPIPIPNINPLQPPLGLLPAPISNIKVLRDTAKLNPMQALSRGLAEGTIMSNDKKYYGKYRGVVLNNIDPLQMGRLMVQIPDVTGLAPGSWAMPCVPVAGIQNGMVALPIIGSGVWVEFEQGDPDYPVWVGCFWGTAAEVPALARVTPPAVPAITLQTPLQNGLTVSDMPGPTGGIILKSTTGAMIIVNDTGIYIQNGKGAMITLIGPTVTINNGALVVI
jgi:hypothetical protein